MKKNIFLTICLITGLVISGCGSGQAFGQTSTPTPINTPTPTNMPTPIPPTTTSIPSTSTPIPPTPVFPVPVTLTIVNNSTTRLTIYSAGKAGGDYGMVKGLWPIGPWSQYGDKSQLKPNTSIDILTYFGNVWAVSNNTVSIAQYIVPLYYVTEDSQQTITITSDGIAIAAKLRSFSTCSLKYTFPIAAVNFVNNSSVALDLHYVSSKQIDQKLNTIPAGNFHRIENVQFGDFFYLSDPGGNNVLVYVATEPTEQTVNISDAAVAYRLGQ